MSSTAEAVVPCPLLVLKSKVWEVSGTCWIKVKRAKTMSAKAKISQHEPWGPFLGFTWSMRNEDAPPWRKVLEHKTTELVKQVSKGSGWLSLQSFQAPIDSEILPIWFTSRWNLFKPIKSPWRKKALLLEWLWLLPLPSAAWRWWPSCPSLANKTTRTTSPNRPEPYGSFSGAHGHGWAEGSTHLHSLGVRAVEVITHNFHLHQRLNRSVWQQSWKQVEKLERIFHQYINYTVLSFDILFSVVLGLLANNSCELCVSFEVFFCKGVLKNLMSFPHTQRHRMHIQSSKRAMG